MILIGSLLFACAHPPYGTVQCVYVRRFLVVKAQMEYFRLTWDAQGLMRMRFRLKLSWYLEIAKNTVDILTSYSFFWE